MLPAIRSYPIILFTCRSEKAASSAIARTRRCLMCKLCHAESEEVTMTNLIDVSCSNTGSDSETYGRFAAADLQTSQAQRALQ